MSQEVLHIVVVAGFNYSDTASNPHEFDERSMNRIGRYLTQHADRRETLVFHGFPDPAETRDAIPDPTRTLIDRLITGWEELYPRGEWVTVANVLLDLKNAERRAAERARVLEPFYRGDRARTPSPTATALGGGFGLGLTLAQRVAEAHGGALTLEDAHPPGSPQPGCRVTLYLPLTPAEAQPAADQS